MTCIGIPRNGFFFSIAKVISNMGVDKGLRALSLNKQSWGFGNYSYVSKNFLPVVPAAQFYGQKIFISMFRKKKLNVPKILEKIF